MYEGLIGRIAEETGVEPDSHSVMRAMMWILDL